MDPRRGPTVRGPGVRLKEQGAGSGAGPDPANWVLGSGGRTSAQKRSLQLTELIESLRVANTAVFAVLASASFVHWRRRGGGAAGWLAASFAILAVVLLEGLILTGEPRGALQWVQKVSVAALLLFPYFLYRFASSFGRPSRRV